MQKGAINLTLNSIVVIIFAVTMLGLGLFFIREQFGNAADKVTFPTPDIEATAQEPIVLPFDTLRVTRGNQAEFSVNFYNNEERNITESDTPQITQCVPDGLGNLSANLAAVGQFIEIGDSAAYEVLLDVPATAPSQKYSCNLRVSGTSKQFVLEVR